MTRSMIDRLGWALALLLLLSAVATAGTGAAWGAAALTTAGAPANTARPVVTGPAEVGGVLDASAGSWSGAPTSYGYQWLANGSPVSGQGPKLVVRPELLGKVLSVKVTATNGSGSTEESSAATAAVKANPWKRVGYPSILTPEQVACATAKLCFMYAVDYRWDRHYWLTFNGTTWSAPSEVKVYNATISCGAAGFCMRVFTFEPMTGNRYARYSRYQNGQWSTPQAMPAIPTTRGGIPWIGYYRALSCASATACAIEVGGGYSQQSGGSGGWLHRFNGSTWGPKLDVVATTHLHAIGCAHQKLCLVHDAGAGTVGVFDGSSTHSVITIQDRWYEVSLGCASATLCLASGKGSRVWNGSAWSASFSGPVGNAGACRMGVGCFGPGSLPVGSTYHLGIYKLVGTAWRLPHVVAFTTQGLMSPMTACTSATSCLLVGDDGVSYARTA